MPTFLPFKKVFLVVVFIFFGCCFIYGQEESVDSLKCENRLRVASQYLAYYENASDSLLEEIAHSTSNCNDGSPNAFFVRGMLGLYTAASEKEMASAFKDIEQAAQLGHPKAATTTGMLYKEGTGCVLNLEASEQWFKKAYKLGDLEAAYALGYFYLKGLGTISQNYRRAVKWFERSGYPMAKHWLAFCEYFGYGMPKNSTNALKNLEENGIENSLFLHSFLEEYAKDSVNISLQGQPLVEAWLQGNLDEKTIRVENKRLKGVEKGVLIELDWSGNDVKRIDPIEFKTIYKDDESFKYRLVLQDSILLEGKGMAYENEAYYENAQLGFENLHPDHEVDTQLFYAINTVSYSRVAFQGEHYLLGFVDAWNINYNEPTPPMILFLKDEYTGLSEEEETTLNSQRDFIKTYPNTFESDFLISYELDKSASVWGELVHYATLENIPIVAGEIQDSGKHIIRYDGSGLKSGLYVIRLQVDDQHYTKLIVKK